MKLGNIDKIYFVGIGGIGMSAIAQWFCKAGFVVEGYDKTPSDITKKLETENIKIYFQDSETSISEIFKTNKTSTLVVYTPAIPKDSKILNYFIQNKYEILKRSQILSQLVQDKKSIAVAGTHGKTSISANLSYLLSKTSLSCSAFLGGVVKNFDSNVLINTDSEMVVVEADEFDRSFLTLYPQTAVISAIDADHLDIYKDKQKMVEAFEQFVKQVQKGGNVLIKHGVDINTNVNKNVKYYTYSINQKTDFYAENVQIKNGMYSFNLVSPFGNIENLKLSVPGLYNVENAIAALAAAIINNADAEQLKKALESYTGVKRRFDVQIRSNKLMMIDDYAHHPAEIEACIKSVRHLYPNKTITGLFQPHLFTRTQDFLEQFAKSLDLLDKALLIPIYPAREKPIEGVTSNAILKKMKLKNKYICEYNEAENKILDLKSDIYLIMGAGDIDRLVKPIKNKLEQKYL